MLTHWLTLSTQREVRRRVQRIESEGAKQWLQTRGVDIDSPNTFYQPGVGLGGGGSMGMGANGAIAAVGYGRKWRADGKINADGSLSDAADDVCPVHGGGAKKDEKIKADVVPPAPVIGCDEEIYELNRPSDIMWNQLGPGLLIVDFQLTFRIIS